jgi:CHAT domain-containing protein
LNPPVAKHLESAMAQGRKFVKQGYFAKALEEFQLAATMARQTGDVVAEARALVSTGSCQIKLFQYRPAVISLTNARNIAVLAKDDMRAGAASVNLATLYDQLGDFSLASKEAAESVRLLANAPDRSYLVRALLNAGDIESQRGHLDDALSLDHRAISVAQEAGLTYEEAVGYDHLGVLLLEVNRLPAAERNLLEAYRLRVLSRNEDQLALSRGNLALLEYKKKNYAASLAMLDAAFASKSPTFLTISPYSPVHLRGEILAAMGRYSDALAEFRKAVDLAGIWRAGALPGDITSTNTVAQLNEVYQDFASLAAQLALERHDHELARQALEVLSENRANSLREQITLALEHENRLSSRYFELLAQLQAAQSRAIWAKTREDEEKADEVRLALSDLENKNGLAPQNISLAVERTSPQKSLGDIQRRLSENEVLLSFCLGTQRSYLWAVTRRQVNLYPLPASSEISRQASMFSKAIETNHNAYAVGQALSNDLFGQLSAEVWQKPEWLVVADGTLLNSVPLAALPGKGSRPARPLGAGHSLRLLPSEQLLLAAKGPAPNPLYLGVADPIYNSADTRGIRNTSNSRGRGPFSYLGRLPGSDQEIRAAARLSGFSQTELLTGREASISKLIDALRKKPAILHFAVHVVSPDGHPEEAALAFSLTEDNMPELLTPEAIATLRVPGSLVILSGCSSEQGRILPGAGLIGLSRAWLLAGAAGVVVSAWPTPDDSGDFFSSFYSHLQGPTSDSGPMARRAAIALQQTQVEMQHKAGYRGLPSFWAAYSIVAKE